MEDDIGNNLFEKLSGPQHHLTITYEPGISSGEYLSHKTLVMTSCPGEVMAQHVYNALEDFDSLESVRKILVDYISVNTGWKNDLFVNLEKSWLSVQNLRIALIKMFISSKLFV